MLDGKSTKISSQDYFADRRVVMFALPGAFTPTCSISHLPGFIHSADRFSEKGIDNIACMSVNDAFVMAAWAKHAKAGPIDMLADGNADFSTAMGLASDKSEFGMGVRCERFALVADNGIVTHLFIEEPGEFLISSAEHVLAQLALSQ
jgi:peroxiredoxin